MRGGHLDDTLEVIYRHIEYWHRCFEVSAYDEVFVECGGDAMQGDEYVPKWSFGGKGRSP